MGDTFRGSATPLTQAGLAAAAQLLQVTPLEIWTLLAVETAGCGFWPDRRPQMRYERHVFSRLTGGRFDDGVISDPEAGGYPPSGPPTGGPMYDRLALAMSRDRRAALMSASWGIGQVMGENYAVAGFADIESMIAAMVESEDAQLLASAKFIKSRRIDAALRNHQWAAYAAVYNGPKYREQQYDTRLASCYQQYAAGKPPDLDVRTAQVYLGYLGHPCSVDGDCGAHTLAALNSFELAQGSGQKSLSIDARTVVTLSGALALA